VELKGRRHTLHLAEPIEDQALLALVEYLSQQAAQQRRAGDRSSHS
jgi:hypothetical protein